MSISHIGFHTTRCHTNMLLNQVTHVLFIHAHFLLFLPTYGYKVINLYIVLTVHTVLTIHSVLTAEQSPYSEHQEE